MALRVLKYGGSSLASLAAIERIADQLARWRRDGDQLVVVCSAMGSATDELLALARKTAPHAVGRELDMLITAGERIAAALLALRLGHVGVPALSLTGSQAGIVTDDNHGQASVLAIRPHRVQAGLNGGHVVVVAGFQGVSEAGNVTTLRRGGSDTTAVALAAALGAQACEIYSDVDRIHTADPALVAEAAPLHELDAPFMHALAQGGARVLAAEAVAMAQQAGIVIQTGHAHDASSLRSRIVPAWSSNCSTLAAIASANAWHVQPASCESADVPTCDNLPPALHGGRASCRSLWPLAGEAAQLLFASPDEAFMAAPSTEAPPAAAPQLGAQRVAPAAVITVVARPTLGGAAVDDALRALAQQHLPARWLMADGLRTLFAVGREHERAAVQALHRCLIAPRLAASP